MLVGYARVSTIEQNLHLQQDAFRAAGCTKVFEDTLSGTREDRPGLEAALEYLRPGDTLVVWKLDRLGRSLPHLIETVRALEARGIGFKSLGYGAERVVARKASLLSELEICAHEQGQKQASA